MRKKTLLILTAVIALSLSIFVGCGNQQETLTPLPTETPTPTEPPHEHVYTERTTKEATCTEAGEKIFVCECGDTMKGETISATGHQYGDYIYNNDATTEKDGTETATCSACGEKETRTATGTKLEPETHWYDGYAKHVWNDMGEYMFWMGDTQEEANDALGPGEELSQALNTLHERYPDRQVYLASSVKDGMPFAFMSTSRGTPGKEGFWRPTFIWE